jgi:tRNA-dihydrouridine synthase 4
MILAKEFNRSHFARDSGMSLKTHAHIPCHGSMRHTIPRNASLTPPQDFSISTNSPQPPTIVQFGSNSPLELSRASSLAAPYASGVDLNCGCPQSWACAETLGAALMEKRELVRDMVITTRDRLRQDGWAVDLDASKDSPKGRSVSVKIRVHKDLRKTMDFIDTVLGPDQNRHIDFLTIHPRTRSTPSSTPINLEALEILTDKYGDRVPILVSGDVFALNALPFTSPLHQPTATFTDYASLIKPYASPSKPADADEDTSGEACKYCLAVNELDMTNRCSAIESRVARIKAKVAELTGNMEGRGGPGNATHQSHPEAESPMPSLPKLAGLMSARAILANPALYAGYDACPWEAVETFMVKAARAPLPYKLVLHHVHEMCSPGMGANKNALLTKQERAQLQQCMNMVDLIDFLDEKKGLRR